MSKNTLLIFTTISCSKIFSLFLSDSKGENEAGIFCGAIGVDGAGLEIVKELKHLRIDTKFLAKKKEKRTNTSVIISSEAGSPRGEAGDRTILVYRGASDLLCDKDILWKKIKTKWIYLAPLAGEQLKFFGNSSYLYRKKN